MIRQTGELVEKLKQKHSEPNTKSSINKEIKVLENLNYNDVSEANAELVRTGAKLSLEDMESEHFSLIAESFNENEVWSKSPTPGSMHTALTDKNDEGMFNQNIEELIDSIPIQDKSMPSPSEILKNLCLSKEDDYIGILQQTDEEKNYEICKDDVFL